MSLDTASMEHNDWMPLEYPTYVKHLSRKHGNFKYKSSLPIFTWPDELYWPEREREGRVLKSSNNKLNKLSSARSKLRVAQKSFAWLWIQ